MVPLHGRTGGGGVEAHLQRGARGAVGEYGLEHVGQHVSRTRIDGLGLGATVHLVGFYPDIRAAFWSSDFFVLPTYYDPCSLVVFEAMACGLPVITTACNGASELLTDGREGYIITDPGALGELTQALDRMADDATRAPMVANAARLGHAHTFDDHAAKLIKVFEEVAGSKSRRGPRATRFANRRVSR